MKSKDKLKNLHIGLDIWKYVVDRAANNFSGEVRIYDKNKKMYRVSTKTLVDFLGETYKEGLAHPHTPSTVKMYICDIIIPDKVLNNIKN